MTQSLLLESATRMLTDKCTPAEVAAADAGAWPERLWAAVEAFGLGLALVGEDAVPLAEAFAVIRLAGELAVPLPLPETMIANWLLGLAGLEPIAGPATVLLGPLLVGERVSGVAHRVAWGRNAGLVAIAEREGRAWAVRLGRAGVTVAPGTNIAHEPRDTLRIDAAAEESAVLPIEADAVFAMMAAARATRWRGR